MGGKSRGGGGGGTGRIRTEEERQALVQERRRLAEEQFQMEQEQSPPITRGARVLQPAVDEPPAITPRPTPGAGASAFVPTSVPTARSPLADNFADLLKEPLKRKSPYRETG